MFTKTRCAIQIIHLLANFYCVAVLGAELPDSSQTLNEAAVQTTSTLKTTTSPGNAQPQNVSTEPPATFSPSVQVHYKMTVTASGPAVLDSKILFEAELIPQVNTTIEPWPVKFVYMWMNMADMSMIKKEGRLLSTLSHIFPEDQIMAGEYTMTVCAVFKEDQSKMAAFDTIKFVLTDQLNGFLYLDQDLPFQRQPNIFSTVYPLRLSANVYDRFINKSELEFDYYWYKNADFLQETQEPFFTMEVSEPSNFTVKSQITVVQKNSAVNTRNSASNLAFSPSVQKRPARGKQIGSSQGPFQTDIRDDFFKSGRFEQHVVFKDPLVYCAPERVDESSDDRGVPIGSTLVINVTCFGSAPSGICVNVTAFNVSIPVEEQCMPTVFSDTVQHQIKIVLNSTGWNDIHFFVYNDISKTYTIQSYYGYDKDSVNVPALVLPIIFGIIGIFIILVGALYIMRMRKKPLVEVADFDFHPSLTNSMPSAASLRLARLVNSIKSIFFRLPNEPHQINEEDAMKSAPLLGENHDTAETAPKRFYDSL